MKRIFNYLIAAVLLAVSLAACAATTQTANGRKVYPGGEHLLTIEGYNYTDHSINSFEVDGVGGGNMGLSSTTSGGGGGTCCVRWRDGSFLPEKVTVKWDYLYCFFIGKNSVGEPMKQYRSQYRTAEAVLNGPIPKNPGYFEVHIYPDEHVEVAITEDTSPPRLKLDESRGARAKPCEGGQ